MAAPDTLTIRYEGAESDRFAHVGRHDSGQFLGYVTYAAPKYYHTEEVSPDGQMVWQHHTNCFVVLHRFDHAGRHLGTDVEQVDGAPATGTSDWAKLEEMIAVFRGVEFGDIRVSPFRVEIGGVVHGLIYESYWEDDEEHEWVMLEPNDIMFHPPWDSGEYSS